MLLSFFLVLKAAKVPVTLREYLSLLEGMQQGLADFDVEAFYFLARTCLVKDERHIDRFDRVFAGRFRGLQTVAGEAGLDLPELPEDWLRRLAERHLTEEEKQLVEALGGLEAPEHARVIVIEGREALLDVSESALEASMHAINSFVRRPSGTDTLVIWPTNTDDLAEALERLGMRLGGRALLGYGETINRFAGPPKTDYMAIAERTIGALNDGASLSALGISEQRAAELVTSVETIGDYLGVIRGELLRNDHRVKELLAAEQFRLWVLVIAGNDVEGDVGSLTRGGFAYADVDRLMYSTEANIVEELKKHPDDLGILGTVLDVKILRLDVFTALAVARQFADEDLRELMKAEGLSAKKDPEALARLTTSELGTILQGGSLGTRRRGKKPGGNTKTAFQGLAKIAAQNDGMLNSAIGRGLEGAGLVAEFETEKSLGTVFKYASDLYIKHPSGDPIRIEVMWRTETGRAAISNYVLSKMGNYAKAIGLLV